MYRSLLAVAITAMISFASGSASAQNTNLSPYSRFGLGDINPSLTTAQFGMGGLGTGYADNAFVNLSNPAAGAFLSKTLFDFGLKTSSVELTTSTQSQKLSTTYINHFVYAFPVKNKYCLTAGLVPYTRVGYRVNDKTAINDSTTANFVYTGNGGLNRAFIGNSYKVLNIKDSTVLSFGLNINFMFGTIDKESRAYFPENQYFFNTKSTVYTTVHDLSFDMGTYFSFYPNKLKPVKVNVGATYSLATSLRATQEIHKETFVTNIVGNEFTVDTIQYLKDNNGSITLPQSLSLGASVVINNRWIIGADYRAQDWSTFKQDLNSTVIKDDLRNATQLSAGIQFTPKPLVVGKSSFFNFMNYRVGFRSESNYIQVRNTQIKGNAFSAGIGIPLRKSNSLTRINIGYEYMSRGTTSNNLIKENYSTFMFGVSLAPVTADRWFYKRKYD